HAEKSISLPLPFCVALKSWMALGTKDFLSLSDEHDSDRSLPLKMLLCPLRVLCSGWWSLSKMVRSLVNVVFTAPDVRQSSSLPTTAPPLLTSLSSRPASLFFMLPPQHTTASTRTLATTHATNTR